MTRPQRLELDLTRSPSAEVVNVRRRQQRSVETRERILRAAFREFAEHGLEGASTRRIAAAAGVQHPLVTHHFEGKEGLWKAVFTTVQRNYTEYFEQYLSGQREADDVAQLRRLQEAFVRFAAKFPDYHWLMAHEGRREGPLLGWLLDGSVSTYFASIAPLIRSAQAKGRYVEGDPVHLQFLFIGAVTRILMQKAEAERVLGRSLTSERFVEDHVRLCCDLFFREPAVGRSSGRRKTAPTATPDTVRANSPRTKVVRLR